MKLKARDQQRKINENKNSFFEKINKGEKPLARLTKEKREHDKFLLQESRMVRNTKLSQ